MHHVQDLRERGYPIEFISTWPEDISGVSLTRFEQPLSGFLTLEGKVANEKPLLGYQVMGKKTRTFSCWERIGRIALGVILTLCTMSLGHFSSGIRGLFSKNQETTYLALLWLDEPSDP